MADSEARCIESLRHTKIKVHDKGTNVSAVFLNPDKRIVERIRVDGCLVPARQTAADFLVSMPGTVDVIVELKGTDLRKAFEQVEATIDFLGNSGFVVGSGRYRGVVWQNICHAGSRVVRGDIGHPEPLAG